MMQIEELLSIRLIDFKAKKIERLFTTNCTFIKSLLPLLFPYTKMGKNLS
jgi:hypothetical protein